MSIAIPQQPQPTTQKLAYDPHGGARALLLSREREILLEGPANTGKSFAGLWKVHLAALKYPGMHGLLLRKTLVSLKASTLVTYRERILGANSPVKFWAARGDESAHYAYPNGSKLYVGGMDKAAKIMSTEYDALLWDEATDGDVGEWEALQTRLRYGVMPYQQAIACCNPQGPSHWLNQRANPASETYDPLRHLMQRITSRHEDNPTVTPDYLAMLERLTGVRRARLYLGAWAAADGMVYEDSWDAQRNIRARASISKRPDDLYGDCGIPHDWPRYLAIDFGFTLTHPFVCRWYAEDGEGTLWMYREIYMTNRLVEDHAKDIRRYSRWGAEHGDPYPRAVICDHDAEGRATLERHLNLHTTKADKRVLEGIQVVAARMRGGANGKPGLIYLRDSLVERDRALVDAKRPTCGAEEVESYIWRLGATAHRAHDEVEKDHDHAMDCDRYLCMYRDMRARQASYGATLF